MINAIRRWFRPAPHQPRLPDSEVKARFPRFRWQVFEAAFVAYAAFYIVRNNFSPVAKQLGESLGYDKVMIGDILAATSIAYGLGKLVMGFLADRSNPRKFLFVGMLLTAFLNFAFGASTEYWMHLSLWGLNGFVQGMGYGPCARGLGHWYSVKERGTIFGVWNISHNIGGGLAGVIAAHSAHHFGWPSAFFVPGVIATIIAFYLLWRMRDTPESLGLPPIEEYTGEVAPRNHHELHERELTTRELLFKYIFTNKWLWLIAIANFFVYIVRYSMLDWGPYYLQEAKGNSLKQGGYSTMVIEFSGAAGMVTMGWISDKIGGRRGRVSALSMIPLLAAFMGVIYTPPGMFWLDMCLFAVIGFFIYTPVMMLGVMSFDLTSKKAVGTAAGFVGLFGYIGRVAQNKGFGYLAEFHGWNAALYGIVASIAIAIFLLAFTWNLRPRREETIEPLEVAGKAKTDHQTSTGPFGTGM